MKTPEHMWKHVNNLWKHVNKCENTWIYECQSAFSWKLFEYPLNKSDITSVPNLQILFILYFLQIWLESGFQVSSICIGVPLFWANRCCKIFVVWRLNFVQFILQNFCILKEPQSRFTNCFPHIWRLLRKFDFGEFQISNGCINATLRDYRGMQRDKRNRLQTNGLESVFTRTCWKSV